MHGINQFASAYTCDVQVAITLEGGGGGANAVGKAEKGVSQAWGGRSDSA